MIIIDNIVIGEEVVEKHFVCDLARCKGGCCEEGDAGAPLEDKELQIIDGVLDDIYPLLTEEGKAEIQVKGNYVRHPEFGWVTPTIGSDNGICVYASRDEKGVIRCAFERAYNDGKIGWRKPVSCHLYPIVVEKGKETGYDRMNYQPRETLCKSGCSMGEKLKLPVYAFLKEALIRKYGEEFYDTLATIAREEFSNEPPALT